MDIGLGNPIVEEEEEGRALQPRRSVRVKLAEVANLRGNGTQAVAVTVCDLSTAGFMAECLRPVLIGSYVSLDLPGIGPVHAQVRWQLGGRLGAKFLDPVSIYRCEWMAAQA